MKQLHALLESAPVAVRKLAVERLKLTEHKAALILVKTINPFEVLTEAEEAVLRGVTEKTLRAMKSPEREELPRVC